MCYLSPWKLEAGSGVWGCCCFSVKGEGDLQGGKRLPLTLGPQLLLFLEEG